MPVIARRVTAAALACFVKGLDKAVSTGEAVTRLLESHAGDGGNIDRAVALGVPAIGVCPTERVIGAAIAAGDAGTGEKVRQG